MSDLKPVTPGDPVTLVLPDHVVQVEVVVSFRDCFHVTLSSRGAKTYDSRWPLEEENVSWLRGYHAADSNEIKACRAAQALSPVVEAQDDTRTAHNAVQVKARQALASWKLP